MKRRDLVKRLAVAASALLPGLGRAEGKSIPKRQKRGATKPVAPIPYAKGERITVAFVLGPGAEVVDFAGPWGVFEYVFLPDQETPPFELYTVAESTVPLRVSGGMTIVPDYRFDDAPQPRLIVVPAMEEPSTAMLTWIRQASRGTDLTLSVCNGVFVLAKAGLLSGKEATSHHGAYALLQADFPDIKVKRGARFVDAGAVSTAGGLTSGIDLALHVVERYFGRRVAEQTATSLEYQGQGWKNPDANVAFARKPVSTDAHPLCPVCEMEVDKQTALSEIYRGRKVYFCSEEHKQRFDQTPERFMPR
ncbi:DJ-1/PfpI family protein [Zoogloea sp.]|uniref:DJ-1/PfpI family protein n=1 Tax=Zoogloea sp. TaxID=49181 RepID=UPI001ACDEC97|nr:DJ-1/PfpI family protein [Zoogloea sp.]MBN8282753.1 DJ-1/PfpI family protein [Zoogloea sp.]